MARLLLLFADTGGGHRSAAEALLEAWQAEHPGRVKAEMVDLFRDYSPFPYRIADRTYPFSIKYCQGIYSATFRGSNGPRRVWVIARVSYNYVRPYLRRLLTEHPADVVVSLHPFFNHWVGWGLRDLGLHVPFLTVVTDLWTGHASWYYPHAHGIIVPTEEARARALRYGIAPERVWVRGLPVARKFTTNLQAAQDRPTLRRQLGLAPEGRVVLLVGGGEGMGPVQPMARAIDAALPLDEPRTQLVVITGRNAVLRSRLQAVPWRHPAHITGFVTNMPEWMAAADVLVSKAGPGTIMEGMLSGLPLILMGKVPGQEDGNVHYITQKEIGIWEPNPQRAALQLRAWLEPGNPALAAMSARARQLGRPDAASAIARDLLAVADETFKGAFHSQPPAFPLSTLRPQRPFRRLVKVGLFRRRV